jgi:phospholipid/cholesterol/gamma-HCH transport system permease protein
MPRPDIAVASLPDGTSEVTLSGEWTLRALVAHIASIEANLARHAQVATTNWNCLAITALDSAGAMLLWRAWGHTLPRNLSASAEQHVIFARLTPTPAQVALTQPLPATATRSWLVIAGAQALHFADYVSSTIELLGRLVLDLIYLARNPHEIPWREISANVYKSGVGAMPVTALVGFLIGVVLSYLSALQLKQFGADIYIINILGIGIVRELGPVLVAVLVAGRSGSAMTAQLGVMRVTDEIDALSVLGISHSLRLVLPKVVALALVMPLLVLWVSAIALLGGMVSAEIQLDISYAFFFDTLPNVVPVANLWIGLAKGLVFGIVVAVVACRYGLRVRPNTESLSSNTTASVVTAITAVIIFDAIFAIAMRGIGLPFR